MLDPQLTMSLTKEQAGSIFVGLTIAKGIDRELFGDQRGVSKVTAQIPTVPFQQIFQRQGQAISIREAGSVMQV